MQDEAQLAALGRTLKQLLMASYGLYPGDVAGELADAARHLGGEDIVLLLADYDQRTLLGYELDDDRSCPIDGPGPGRAFRHEVVVEEALAAGRRRLWVPVKDSAERIGVFGVVDDGSIAHDMWEAVGSLIGELVVSKTEYGDHITLRKRNGDFSLAAEMRWALLPPLTFTAPDANLAGFLQPSHDVGGDAFDYAVTGRTAAAAVFDAMGHGLEASRMANVAVSTYRNARRAGLGPSEALARVDEVIASEFGNSRFVTAQAALLDLDSGRLEIANAGHPPPLLLRAGAPAEPIACAPARPAGLGAEPSSIFVELQDAESVLFRTDGIVDARSPSGDPFGDERLATLIGDLLAEDVPPSEVLRRSIHAVIDHQDGRPGDDATLLLVRWHATNRLIPGPPQASERAIGQLERHR